MSTKRIKSGVALVVATWIVSRMLLAVTLFAAAANSDQSLAQVFDNWDVAHFIYIAENGYNPKEIAFFPGLPLLLKAFSLVGVPMVVSATVIAQIGSALATWALYRLYGPAAACFWLICPMAVFTFVGYTEAPFAAAAFWSWERAQKGRWGQAGWLLAIACSFRITGLFLIAGLGIMALTQTKKKFSDRIWDATWLLLGVAVILAYLTYIFTETGSWTAWYDAQHTGWSRTIEWPWTGLKTTIRLTSPEFCDGSVRMANIFKFEIASVALGTIATIISFIIRRWGEGTYLAANVVAYSFSGWFMSVNRGVLLWFPVFGGLNWIFDRKPKSENGRTLLMLAAIILAAVSCWMMIWWAYGYGLSQWSS